MKKSLLVILIASGMLFFCLAPHSAPKPSIGVEYTMGYFKEHAEQFSISAGELANKIKDISPGDAHSVKMAKAALVNCRMHFKQIEFFFNYFFPSLTVIYNAAPVVEVEEPFMEYRDPTGLQVIASLLFTKEPWLVKKELLQQVNLVYESSKDYYALLYNLRVNDAMILESVRLELINLETLGIAGFDTPELKTGIIEAAQTLKALRNVLLPYTEMNIPESDSTAFYLNKAISLLNSAKGFDTFDRLGFLTEAGIPLQVHLGLFIRQAGLQINTTAALNYAANNIFRPDAIDISERLSVDTNLAMLGRRLFFETLLSGNATRSCASCHLPEKYFTDGLPRSSTIDGQATVARNAPSLFYSAFQYSQFWDGRVSNLEQQIMEVLKNPFEMNGNYDSITASLKRNTGYQESFNKAFHQKNIDSSINIVHVSVAIAAFLKTLSPFNSAFDKYIDGDKQALSKEQIAGFNLFMGKALCATCHTVPLFNGLTPPLYNRTAMEIIGTTSDTVFSKPRLDADKGRFSTYPIEFYLSAFKIPSLRNISKTAPYMHNGAFDNLESVIEFYNKGGGKGLGLSVKHQTLSPDPLNLDKNEMKSIIAFLNALTDDTY